MNVKIFVCLILLSSYFFFHYFASFYSSSSWCSTKPSLSLTSFKRRVSLLLSIAEKEGPVKLCTRFILPPLFSVVRNLEQCLLYKLMCCMFGSNLRNHFIHKDILPLHSLHFFDDVKVILKRDLLC